MSWVRKHLEVPQIDPLITILCDYLFRPYNTSNPAIVAALDAIKDSQGLAAFLQDVTTAVVEKGMDQEKMKAGVKKFGQAILSAKKP